MIRVCSWCGKELGVKPPYDDKSHTDGICDDCLLRYFPDIYEKVIGIIGEQDNDNNSSVLQRL